MRVTEIKVGRKLYTPTKTNTKYRQCACYGCAFREKGHCHSINYLCSDMGITKVWEEKK